jgi:hypothetical protein
MPQFVSAAEVRGYMGTADTTGVWSDASLGSNIIAASSFLERRTGRQFEALTGATKKFSTEGRTYLTIPDLRTVTSVALAGVTLASDTTYYLIPDRHDVTIFTGIQFRAFQSRQDANKSYLANPEWFDRNLDNPRAWGNVYDSALPNDLVITGNWGWVPIPAEVTQATKVLAAFYTKRPDSVLADVEITPAGNARIFSGLPLEIREFIMDWTLGERAISVG